MVSSSSSSSPETNKFVLTSSDGVSFEVEEPVARELRIVANMIDDDCASKAIPLANVNGEILAKVIEYCKKHVEERGSALVEEEEDEEEAKKKLKDWDAKFMKYFDVDSVFELILAANYLNIGSLLELTCQTAADNIKDKPVEEVRQLFNIENDFTPEEEEALRKENEWAFN